MEGAQRPTFKYMAKEEGSGRDRGVAREVGGKAGVRHVAHRMRKWAYVPNAAEQQQLSRRKIGEGSMNC